MMDEFTPSFPIANTDEAKAGRLLVLEEGIKYALFILVLKKVYNERSGAEGIQKHIGWASHHLSAHINGLPEKTREHAKNYAANIFGEVIWSLEQSLGLLPKNAEEARRLALVQKFMSDLSGPGSNDKVN